MAQDMIIILHVCVLVNKAQLGKHERTVSQHAGVADAFIALCQGERVLEDCGGLREPSLDWSCVLGALWKTLYSRN